MMENDIDKIFKEGLENNVEPTYASDWNAFEKTLVASPFYKSAWFLGLLAFLLVATAGFSVYTLVNSEEPVYFSRTSQENKANSEKSEGTTNEKAGYSNSDQNDISDNNKHTESLSQSSSELTDSKAEKIILDGSGEKGDSANLRSKKSNEAARSDDSQGNNGGTKSAASANELVASTENSESDKNSSNTSNEPNIALNDKAKSRNSASASMVGVAAVANEESKIAKNSETSKETNSTNASTQANSQSLENGQPGKRETVVDSGLAEMPIHNATVIFPLGAIVSRDAPDFEILENNNKMDLPKINSFGYAIFFGLEQNAILNTSPSFGIVLRKHFSKWSAEAGIAYQQSGELGWTQQNNSVTYGFDRYENTVLLKTNKIDLVSLPLKLSYRIGGQSQVFAGFTPSVLVNARQEKFFYNDGTLVRDAYEKGYLYNSQAPELIYFLSAGYTYSLSEQFQLDLGLNYSFQEWQATDSKPVGGFVKFYYTFR